MDKFDLFFCTLAGWTLHPGYQRPGTSLPTLDEIALLAEQMVDISDARAVVIEEEELLCSDEARLRRRTSLPS